MTLGPLSLFSPLSPLADRTGPTDQTDLTFFVEADDE